MNHFFVKLMIVLVVLVAVSLAPISAQLEQGCVEHYDPEVDYFPDKATLSYAEGLEIEYFNHYKRVRVINPWRDADTVFEYVLVQCGTPIPEGSDHTQVIEIPVDRVITLSTTYLPHLKNLDLLELLVGVEDFRYVNTPDVRAMIDAGLLTQVSGDSGLNIERVLDLAPDLMLSFAVGNPEYDSHPMLLEAGIPTAINASYMETSPLGRSEWIKFTALFFNREAQAEAVFENIRTQYETFSALTQNVSDRPTVLVGVPSRDRWTVPGGNGYVAHFLADAGASYLWADDASTGNIPLDFESVLERGIDADYWINTGSWTSLNDALADDERLADFAAFQHGQVFNNNARLNGVGGNDYWETGVENPHLILEDLIHIFHPELLPEHDLYFYRQLTSGGA